MDRPVGDFPIRLRDADDPSLPTFLAIARTIAEDARSGRLAPGTRLPGSRELATTLGRVLRRPAVLPLPEAAVRAAFGEMGEVMLLGGQRVVSERLQKAGFGLRYPELEAALRLELGRLAP